ncbi:dTMP kinase [Halobacteriales archaeon QS_9_67_17]|nr:MAG: dTMP kinase [Halobacteriales archaeon QS_9_67_17]
MLVTLEGIDGAGKTTVLSALSDAYPEAVVTREPSESWYGEAVERSIAAPDSDSLAELFLFLADHADHLGRVVQPALADGALVIADRYVDSRIAYQGATLGDEVKRPMEYIRGIHEPFTRMPDLTLYLDIDPETAAERAGATNKMEHVDFLADVRANYERLIDAEPDRFVRIDATQPPEEVIAVAEETLARVVDET